jgi:chromosome segregation protein
MTPEDVIASLKKKIDRLGPVNMMAIEQFDELESRHTFLTRSARTCSIRSRQTGEAIRKIDKTTRERFTRRSTRSTRTSRPRSPRCSAAAAPA